MVQQKQSNQSENMKISISKTKVYDLKEFVAKVYIKKKGKNSFDAVFVDCNKHHYKTRLSGATRLYFVVFGKGNFIINGKHEKAVLYDLFVINDGDVYEYSGKMKLIEVNVPATNPSNEEKLE